jgi:hypothetical protein
VVRGHLDRLYTGSGLGLWTENGAVRLIMPRLPKSIAMSVTTKSPESGITQVTFRVLSDSLIPIKDMAVMCQEHETNCFNTICSVT